MLSIEQIKAFYPGFPQDTQTTIHLLKEYIELPAAEWDKIAAKLQPVYDEEARNFSGIGKQLYDLKLKIEGEWKPSN